jgi:cytoskeletal protein CcmA (bactofilin family)
MRVVALQDEAATLTNALLGREPEPGRLRPQTAPARDLAWGLPAAVAGVTLLLAIIGVLVELRLPGVLDLLNPRRLMGVYEMAFDSVFMLQDRLPGLLEAATSIGAIVATSALGCAAVHALSQRLTKSSLLSLALLLAIGAPETARAVDLRRDQDTRIAEGETISESLVCTGDVVIIDGTVDGDLVVGAERVTIGGVVTGNLFVFGEEVEIDGEVRGSIVVIGERTRLGGQVDGSATLAGERVTIAESARVARDLSVFGEGIRVDGTAGRDVTFGGEWIEVRGKIGRDLHVLGADRIALLDGARVGRDVRARLMHGEKDIEQASGATVGGETTVEERSIVHEHYLAHYTHPKFYLTLLVAAAAAFVFGLLMYLLDPRLFEADTPDARGFFRSLGVGFVVLLAGPVALLLIGLTVVGIPIAALGVFLLVLALYTSYVIVAGLIGRTLLAPSGPGLGRFAPSLLVGILILSVLASLPFVGPAVRIVAVLFGLGCLLERVRGLHALNLRGIRIQG